MYRGWCPGMVFLRNTRCVSMMTLDMKGAFDRVPRAKLVQVLADMGIPEWLVDITYSFLLGRVEFNVVTRNTVIGSREVCCLEGVVWKTESS